MNIVIYARYSSHSQTEQSIEGQFQTCYEYARNNGHIVVGEYIDRAQSGTTDSRVNFQKMIADSDKHTFEAVLVYQLDRFARNRYDSAINKAKLKKNGIRVISARENISDDASGILVEGVLESMAEYYSAELSQKIRRGMDINAEKCLSNGSNPGLGYTVDSERHFHIDPEGAAIVREIFEMYASGKTVTEINKHLNDKKVTTSLGNAFNKNSLHRLLRNKRYIGTYIYKDTEVPGGMPRIIEDELFERVQHILDRNKKAPARVRGKEEYLLTTKLFCGYCKEMMTGYGGTGKLGKAYHYYACNNMKKKKCKKKIVNKQYIEDRVVLECRKLLTEKNIENIAASVAAACEADYDSSAVKRLKMALREADTAIENLWKALEQGQAAEKITERIEKREKEKAELQAQIAVEMNRQIVLTAPQIRAFLHSLKKGDVNDINNRRGIINVFLRAIYLYDDRLTLILNGGDKPITIEDIPLDEIEASNEEYLCSSLVAGAPPSLTDKIAGFLKKPITMGFFRLRNTEQKKYVFHSWISNFHIFSKILV
nr:recombinase family protein [uncultured Christensenella sp.]